MSDQILSPEQMLALSKFGDLPEEVRNAVRPGQYDGSFTITVDYKLKVGEDYKQDIVAKADPWRLLAVALSKLNGVTVDAIVRESIDGNLSIKTIKAEAGEAIQKIKATTETLCKGKVTGKAKVTAVIDQP